MHFVDRRAFLSASLGGLAAAAVAAPLLKNDASSQDGEQGSLRPDTLFLTWQRDPTTTMTVQWIGPPVSADNTAVEYASAGEGKGWHSVATRDRGYPRSELRAYRAELTGLKPGTEYQFRIGQQSPTYRFRTMPAKATDAFQFVSGGDCGINSHAIANNILAARQDPMFALIGGDLGYDDGVKVDVSLEFLRNYSRHMIDSQERLIPMVVCIGNHEVARGYDQPREAAPFFFAVHDGLFAERSYATLDFGDYLSLVLLDTGHVAPIGGEQTAWLDKTLAERAELAHLLVVNHVPAYPSARGFDGTKDQGKTWTGALNRKHWVPLFERHNVDVVLEHHDHTFKRTHPLKDGLIDANGVLYLGDGSWGKLRNPKTPAERSYLAASGKSYHLSLHRLEGEQRFHMALETGGRVVDVCTTRKRPRHRVGRS